MLKSIIIPNINGYKLYTSVIHQHHITGILHGLFMPVACIGFFFCIGALFGKKVARNTLRAILLLMITGWATFDQLFGLLTVLIYWFMISYALHYSKPSFIKGVIMMILSIFVMEFIGHWYLEGYASNLREIINSIYWTPIYGIKELWSAAINVNLFKF